MSGMNLLHRWLIDRLKGTRSGQVLIFFAILVPILIAMVAVVTDTGQIWMNRRFLQNAADAAALAGVQELPEEAGPARSVACDYATVKNAITGMTVACNGSDIQIYQTYFPNDTITVTTRKEIVPMIGGMFGWPTIDISASATALVGSVGSACTVPFFQTQDLLEASGVWDGNGIALNQPTVMKTDAEGNNSGNFLALRVDGSSSASVFRNAISDVNRCLGDDPPQTSGDGTSNTGNMDGPFDQGMKEREAKWIQQGNCLLPTATSYLQEDGTLWNGETQLTPETCYRMVVIPILEGHSSSFKGTTTAKIKGFAMFYISNWCGNLSTPKVQAGTCPWPSEVPPNGSETFNKAELWGYYVGFIAAGTDYVPYDGFGTKVFVLID